MFMQTRLFFCGLFFAVLCVVSPAVFGVSGTYNHSPVFSKSATGIASFHDNSAIVVNPANLSFVKKGSFLVAYQSIGTGNYERSYSIGGQKNTANYGDISLFHMAFSKRVSKRLTLGIGQFMLGGVGFDYENTPLGTVKGAAFPQTVQASASYQLSDQLALGASLGAVSFIDYENTALGVSFSYASSPQIRLGANYQIDDGFRVGVMASIRAQTKLKEGGNTIDSKGVIPGTLGLGLYYDFGFVQVDFDMVHYYWSDTTYKRQFGWKNATSFQLNIEKPLTDTWFVGGGAMLSGDHVRSSLSNTQKLYNAISLPSNQKTRFQGYVSYRQEAYSVTLALSKGITESKTYNNVNTASGVVNIKSIENEDTVSLKAQFNL